MLDAEMSQPQKRPALKMRKYGAAWLVDFLMCWLALCGLANFAIDVASFAFRVDAIGLAPDATSTERVASIGFNVLLSVVGFTYMLWRHQWQYRLTTLLIVAAFWCISFAIAPIMQSNVTAGAIAIMGLGTGALLYALVWSFRGTPDRKQKIERDKGDPVS